MLSRKNLSLIPLDEHIEQWRRDYREMGPMFFGNPPDFGEIIETVRDFQERCNKE